MKRQSILAACIGLLGIALCPVGEAWAQRGEREIRAPGQFRQPGMSKDERQRLRDDMQEVNRDREGARQGPRQMSPQEREKLRRDIQDANRDLKR